jgi:hypothetical protein
LYLHMEASQHSLLAACFTLHSINATLAIVPQRGAGLWIIRVYVLYIVLRHVLALYDHHLVKYLHSLSLILGHVYNWRMSLLLFVNVNINI